MEKLLFIANAQEYLHDIFKNIAVVFRD